LYFLDWRIGWIELGDQFNDFRKAGLWLSEHALVLLSKHTILGIYEHIFMVRRIIRSLAIIRVHRPDELFDVVVVTEAEVEHVLKVGALMFVDADENG